MKKIFSLALSFALIFGLASCSKDNTLETPNGGDDGLSSISFTFNKPKAAYVQTYADIASTAEWFIDELDVYAAVDGTVTKLTKDTHYTQVDGEKAYTITMKSDWVSPNTGKTVNFYFVGNDATSIEGAQSELAATAEATFKNALTDEITLDGTKVKLIEANGSTKNLLFSAVIENVRVVGKVQKSGTLKRREARFDIVNTDNANVTVNKIYVSDASRKGLIFTNANVAAPVITKGSHKDIAGPTVYDAAGLATSVFYLYPTTLSETGTKIYLEATANGNTSMYLVEVANDFEILPNYRYKIVLDPATMVFTLIVADYDEGDEFPVIPANGRMGFIGGTGGAGFWNFNSYNLAAGTETLTATLSVPSAAGATATVTQISGAAGVTDNTKVTAGPVTLTYGEASYQQTFTIVTSYSTAVPETKTVVTFACKNDANNIAELVLHDGITTGEPESNSYMTKPNGDVIRIPISRAYAYWNDGTTVLDETGEVFTAEFLWTDVAAGKRGDGAVAEIAVVGKGKSAYLYVRPGSTEGNTVIAVKDDEGKIRWSWHIWTTNYDPSIHSANGDGQVFMDRYVGALTNSYDKKGLHLGLIYQFGRKDPFTHLKHIYNAQGGVLTATSDQICDFAIEGPITTSNSIASPNSFVKMEVAVSNWCSENDGLSYLWHDTNATNSGDKSIYDPCPAGWRIPEFGEVNNGALWTKASDGYNNAEYGGYFPVFGSWEYSAEVWGNDDRGSFWLSTSETSTTVRVFTYRLSNSIAYNSNSGRSSGRAVRCIKE